MAEIIDLNAIRSLIEESDRSDRHVMMQHILLEAFRQMKDLGASRTDIIRVLRWAVEVLEKGREK
jgi:hypothetical protein